MGTSAFHPDDLPPSYVTPQDGALQRQLEDAIGKRFYEGCDGVTQLILSSCDWRMTQEIDALSLVIHCYDGMDYWHLMVNLAELEERIKQFTHHCRVQIFSPLMNDDSPFELDLVKLSDS